MLLDDYEEFNDSQLKVLENYVTNTRGNIFALRNLPEVIKGALFSRYSRSNLGLRSLLLKEFIQDKEETGFDAIVSCGSEGKDQLEGIKKAQNFYDRILDGYGDDSIGELGGAHLAVENISMIAAKVIEDCRIGGSPLEKSTRYIYFDQKVNGEYLFYKEPVLMTSAYRELYVDTCNDLFETYSRLIPPLTEIIEQKMTKAPEVSKVAYAAALRAKVLDCLRALLPTGALTNMGLFGNGRFFEHLIHKLQCSNLVELQEIGKRMYEELSKVIPSFVRRADTSHHTHIAYAKFTESMHEHLRLAAAENFSREDKGDAPSVSLIYADQEAPIKVAAALLYPYTNLPLEEMIRSCKEFSDEELGAILDLACQFRETRRQKSPRALEHATFTFEIVADFGVYRDLQRHRLLTQDRQLLTCNLGYCIPEEILGTTLEKEYKEAMDRAKKAFLTIASELPEEAQYVVPMGYHIRWYFHVNLRSLQWLAELRSSPAGHPNYRFIAQKMAKQVIDRYPIFERFFKFVNYEGYQLGRMEQEIRAVQRHG